jgi:Ca-activated chloride channel family protein
MSMTRRAMLAGCARVALGLQPPSGVPTFRAEARLVEIHASVFDGRGRRMTGLAREDFEISDSGRAFAPEIFESEESPFSLGLLIDITGSMEDALPLVKKACLDLLAELRPNDPLAVFAFHDRLAVSGEFSVDRQQAAAAIRRLRAGGKTALFDSMARVSIQMASRKGKKALIVLTDGEDNASSLTLHSAVLRAKREAIQIHCIAQGAALHSRKLMDTLEAIAQATGSSVFRMEKASKIGEIFTEICRDLLSSYLLAYKPQPGAGEWRPINVRVRKVKGARVRCREGYFAG